MIDTSTPTSTRQRQTQELKEQGRSIYLANRALGWEMTGAELGAAVVPEKSDRWGRKLIAEIIATEDRADVATSPVPAEGSEPSAPDRHDTTPAAAEATSLPPIVTPPAQTEPSPVVVAEGPVEEPESAAPVRHETGTAQSKRPLQVWPVWLLLLPASVAIWSGWVGLGEKAGFGPVQLLPGIADVEINTAITLPIGMEVYSAYALYVWLSGRATGRALTFARLSAIIALLVGALGQVAYHVMEAAGVGVAPWYITAGVACLPVGVVGLGAALGHMVRAEAHQDRIDAAAVPPLPA